MAVDHKDLTGADLHEPKGVATAPAGAIWVYDGAGDIDWQKFPRIEVLPNTTEVTVTTPTAYTAAPCSNAGAVDGYFFSVATDTGIITYTGEDTRVCLVEWSCYVAQTDASARDVYVAVALNTIPQTNYEMVETLSQNVYSPVSSKFLISLSKNDKLQLYVKVAAGNVKINKGRINVRGLAI